MNLPGTSLERQIRASPGRYFKTSPGRQIKTCTGRSNRIFRARPEDVWGRRPWDNLGTNICARDYTRDNNNLGIPINVRPDFNNIVEDIINNNTQANNDQSTVFIEPEIKKIEPEIEQKLTLHEIVKKYLQ